MKKPLQNRPSSGFALISTLAILVVVTILVVAYASTMRSERAASQNFAERERAQAIAQGMLNRILADHAAPVLTGTTQLKAYSDPAYYDDRAKLPLSSSPYNADPPIAGIYTLPPQPDLVNETPNNTLVRISKTTKGQGQPAYTPEDWAYMRQKVTDDDPDKAEKIKAFYPQDSTGTPIAPEWVDYFEPLGNGSGQHSDIASGQVAFTVWDESGKWDINMAGADPNVNGMAPHNLRLEDLSRSPTDLLDYLNGTPDTEVDKKKPRQRSNFSLRTITAATGTNNDTGNDRWFFTDEELLARKLLDPKTAALDVTTVSRDFDVRPEWDGDRTGVKAQKFLRSYINNPELFSLFTTNSGLVSSKLIAQCVNANGTLVGQNTLDTVASSLAASVGGSADNWNQVLHLLAAIRVSLPPYQPTTLSGSETTPLSMTEWYDEDVYGILLNILQGTAPASDENLIAYDRANHAHAPFSDPTCRVGVRLSPYITEIAMKVTKIDDTHIEATEYIEIWNPYAIPLLKPDGVTPIQYTYGEFTGGEWPKPANAIYGMTNTKGYSTPTGDLDTNPDGIPRNISAPLPGQFAVVKLTRRKISLKPDTDPATEGGRIKADGGFLPRVRTYMQNYDYFRLHKTGSGSEDESTSFAVSSGPLYTTGDNNRMFAYFPQNKLNQLLAGITPSLWFSFQIDDPRMGGATRNVSNFKDPSSPPQPPGFDYSWVAYADVHSLYGGEEKYKKSGELELAPGLKKNGNPLLTDGYNANFGSKWPTGVEPFSLARALGTFALPGRPYANVGEMGSIFALRPWRTLSYGFTTAPNDQAMRTVAQTRTAKNYPTTLLDYLTTIGNTTSSRKLNFKTENDSQSGSVLDKDPDNILHTTKRQQDLTWLFDKVDAQNKITTASNIRPIRGRLNLNVASTENITRLLVAPYRLAPSLGLLQEFKPDKDAGNGWLDENGALITGALLDGDPKKINYDYQVTIAAKDAKALAAAITEPDSKKKIRPLRSLADLGKLDLDDKAGSVMKKLRQDYPDAVMDAIMGRLAQFGTVRQQYFTVDMIAQTLNPNAEKRRKTDPKAPRVVTSEVRMLARVYFDTFSRKAYIESIEYR